MEQTPNKPAMMWVVLMSLEVWSLEHFLVDAKLAWLVGGLCLHPTFGTYVCLPPRNIMTQIDVSMMIEPK